MGDFTKIGLGEGKLHFNYEEIDTIVGGYVRGGTFTENLTMRHIEVDGKKGNLMGDAIVESVMPTLEVTMMEVDSTNWALAFGNMTVDASAPASTKITRRLAVVAGDYLKNITYVGKTKAGKAIIIKLLNALGEGGINLAWADKAELEIPAMFTGNYTDEDDTIAPYEIIIDETITVATAAITGVTVPVTGETPVATIAATDEYTTTIAWVPTDATFAASTVYTATITLTPKSGYTLTGVGANFFTVSGATATNSANAGIITAVFPATVA
jgi:hypothetical protein